MTGTGKGFQGICHTLFLVLCSGLRDKVYLTIYYTDTGKFFVLVLYLLTAESGRGH